MQNQPMTVSYEIFLAVGIVGVALMHIDEPEGILEMDIRNTGIEDWFVCCITPAMEQQHDKALDTGEWHLIGKLKTGEDDIVYTVDYASQTRHYA